MVYRAMNHVYRAMNFSLRRCSDVAVTSQSCSRRHRTSLREALEIRIADFKRCVLLPLLLLLFEKPSTFCRRLEGPENHICQLLQRALEKVY